jgi:hypothetical protein
VRGEEGKFGAVSGECNWSKRGEKKETGAEKLVVFVRVLCGGRHSPKTLI